jgi:hypothetical protein
MYQQLVDDLALQIRDYPRNGGPRPDGMQLLQRGRGRVVPVTWPRNSTVPNDVAELLLGIQFHNKKAVASCFVAAEAVAQLLQLELTWREDYVLGGFLISCLIKAGYYRLFNILRSERRFEYALQARRKAIRELAEDDPWTSHEPFPAWTSGVDDAGRRLVKPSTPQTKRTVWTPDDTEFQRRKHGMQGYRLQEQLRGFVNVWEVEEDDRPVVEPSVWIRGINKLEQNAYRINQRLLREVLSNSDLHPTEKNQRLENEFNALMRERNTRKRGGMWDDLEPDQRYLTYLDELWQLQVQQDERRRSRGHEPHPPEHRSRRITIAQDDVRREFWRRYYANQDARDVWATHYNDFARTIERATQLSDKPFYQRAFVDYRGRVYLNRSIVNYQAGDLHRGLIDFADGKRVRKSDMKYLWIHLANTWGIRGDADTRETAARMRKNEFLRWGKRPANYYDQWRDVDSPFQFIRACMELVELEKNPNYKSSLIVEVDQSTSCIQHVAMIQGDRNLARRVNLSDQYNDIYQEIANDIDEIAELEANNRRKIIKMALVPWTYGGNAWSACQNYHKSEMPFLNEMTSSERLRFAHRMIHEIEDSLRSVVGYTNEMTGETDLRFQNTNQRNAIWASPSGFEVHCYKQQTRESRVYVWASAAEEEGERDKHHRLLAWEPTDTPDPDRVRSAFPPNFVHSIDAAVMHFIMAYTPDDQSCVGIHDALGTHIRHVEEAKERFKNSFHRIYSILNPRQMVIEGVPQGIAFADEEQLPPELLREVYLATHMTD